MIKKKVKRGQEGESNYFKTFAVNPISLAFQYHWRYHWRFSHSLLHFLHSLLLFSEPPHNKTKTTRIKPVWYASRQLILTFRTKENKAYQLDIGSQNTLVYCHMNDTGLGACGGGGWTLVMKIDGNQVQSLIFTSFVLIWYN